MNEILLYKLLQQHKELAHLIHPLDEAFIQKRQRPDKWSIYENLAHLGRYQEIFIDRIKTILKENRPPFGRYKAEDDPAFESWTSKKLDTIITDLTVERNKIKELLLGLSKEQLNRKGGHPVFGLLKVEEWLHFFLLHESHHLYTIFRMIHQYKK